MCGVCACETGGTMSYRRSKRKEMGDGPCAGDLNFNFAEL